MLTFRHHIHLICDCLDSSIHQIHDCLNLFFEEKAYITSNLFLMCPKSSSYCWNCINACDFAIMIIGDSYGALTNTGVSQLHISYLNAKTKNKPLVVFIKESDGQKSRQLNDLLTLIRQQVSENNIYYFQDKQNTETMVKAAYERLQILASEQHRQPTKMSGSNLPLNHYLPLSQKIIKENRRAIAHETNHSLSAMSYRQMGGFVPHIQDELLINCHAHAFQGGTLIEVAFMASSAWHQVLSTLVNHVAPFSSQGLWRLLNDMVGTQAMKMVQMTHPDVHAISRCQVAKADVAWIKETLVNAQWIEKSPTAKEAWKATDLAKNLLKSL